MSKSDVKNRRMEDRELLEDLQQKGEGAVLVNTKPEPTIIVQVTLPMRHAQELRYRAKKEGMLLSDYLSKALNLQDHIN